MKAVNLLPESRRVNVQSAARSQARAAKATVVTAGVAISLIVAFSAVAVVNGRTAANDKQATLDMLEQQVNDAQAATRAAEAAKSEVKVRFDAVSIAASPAKRMRWDDLLDAVARVLPKDAWLSGMKAESPVPVVVDPTATPAGSASATPSLPTAFVISGYTTSNSALPRVLRRLELLPMLADVWLQQSTRVEIGGKIAIQFTIAANLRGGNS